MNLSSLSSFATAAFDTTRSTFKAMAEAAVSPADTDGPARPTPATPSDTGDRQGAPTRAAVRPAEAKGVGRADAEEQKPSAKGRRRGTVLDAYA